MILARPERMAVEAALADTRALRPARAFRGGAAGPGPDMILTRPERMAVEAALADTRALRPARAFGRSPDPAAGWAFAGPADSRERRHSRSW